MEGNLQIGARVYLRNCIAGEPGCIVGFDRKGRAEIFWPDLYAEMGHNTHHHVGTLQVDEAFQVRQLDLFERAA
jgi:hypothetical protein